MAAQELAGAGGFVPVMFSQDFGGCGFMPYTDDCSIPDGASGRHLWTNRPRLVAMVRWMTIAVLLTGTLSLSARAFEKVDGPGFFNGTARNVQLRVTFQNGDVFPVALIPGAMGIYWDHQQVMAVDVDGGSGHRLDLSGATLPRVPDGLSEPFDHVWLIDENRVCVVPRHDFDRDKHPKC